MAMGIIPTRIGVVFVSFMVGIFIYGAHTTGEELSSLRKANFKLETTLKEKNRHLGNRNLVCAELDDPMGEIVLLDCGESFTPRYATCACTLWCLDDFSFVTNNLSPEDCKAVGEENL